MKNLIEIVWYGRGGQGVVTAGKIFAEAALSEGKHIQAFPEYGPERMGAPIRSFTRISENPIRVHSQVRHPLIVVVLDATLLGAIDITEGLSSDGLILINIDKSAKQVRQEFGIEKRRIFTVDASKIALETIGRNIPNTPMVGALAKVSGLLKLERLIEDFKKNYSDKFSEKILHSNIDAIRRAYEKVKGE